jgi:hypothetical protein
MGRTHTADDLTPVRQWQAAIQNSHRTDIYAAILSAGERGITRAEIAKAVGLSSITVGRRIDEMMAPEKRIYIAGWRVASGHQHPAYAIGAGPDVERPEYVKKEIDHGAHAEALARSDAEKKHKAWVMTWKPHCDVAAAWMVGRAV